MAAGEGIEIYAVAGNNDFSSPICEHREAQIVYLRELIRMAADFGAPAVRVFLAWPGVTKHPQIASYTLARNIWEHTHALTTSADDWSRCRDALAECVRYAADYGVTLALQNHAPIVTSYKDVLRMIRQVNSPHLKACLDLPLLSDKSPEGIRAATTEVGSLQVLSHFGGEYDRALDLYQAVADGAYPVRRADRINAMTNVGWVLMYRTPEYRRAYRAYREIELFTGSDTVRANALAEQAWIMFEILRHDEVGSWPEVRRFCARAIASFDTGDSSERAKHRAVLELIHLETYFQERDYESTARCARAFLDAYRGVPERRREVAMATSWLGISQVNLNQLGEAKGTFEGLIAMEVRPSENFGGENMDRLAASWLFHIADLQRDASAMHFWGE